MPERAPDKLGVLLRRCLRGEPGAADAFVDAALPLVYAMTSKVLRSGLPCDPAMNIEDIVQEVFVRFFKDGARLLRVYNPARSSVSTWLTVIARSVVLDILRRRRLESSPGELAEGVPASDGCQDLDELKDLLEGCSSILSTRQMLIMRLIYDKGWDVNEVARELGIKEQTVRSLKHKALQKLREVFGAEPAHVRRLT